MEQHLITREIGIDMGHRVTHHGSKCRNLHGHRYTVQATCNGPLFVEGEQQGMVLDFGFLKDLMMEAIDDKCDHGTALWVDDPILEQSIFKHGNFDMIRGQVMQYGAALLLNTNPVFAKLYVTPFVPTAENLAKHWFDLIAPAVEKLTHGQASLWQIKVWETPNCASVYPSDPVALSAQRPTKKFEGVAAQGTLL